MRVKVIDSHTGGEPTRVVIEGSPDLGQGSIAERSLRFRTEHDWLRSAVCNEPRGHEAMVGALLCSAHEKDCCCGVVFFNNVSTLNMCVHGTMGLVETLRHMGRIGPGRHRIETPVGVVTAELAADGKVTVANVPSYRHAVDVVVDVPGWGEVRGDVAWGGNWFFLIEGQGPDLGADKLDELVRFTWAVRRSLAAQGITGKGDMEIDHIETFGPPADPLLADSRNFVLCPGRAYDRSPCGTGTSAKLACLHASGKLHPGQVWRQAGILNTVFDCRIEVLADGGILPHITGRAWINGEAEYFFHPEDPFKYGVQSNP